MKLNTEQIEFLREVTWGSNIRIDYEKCTVDVEGDVFIPREIDKLPVSFGEVTGSFMCKNTLMSNLEGFPHTVLGSFNCSDNQLLSNLVGCPRHIGGDFECLFNNLNSLEGFPDIIGGEFIFYLSSINPKYLDIIIPQLLLLIKKGVKVHYPDIYIKPHIDRWYENKMLGELNG